MTLVGFGCSFTYGSELLNPELEDSWDRHNDNTPYREKHTWLGQLAERLDCKAINLAEPGCSNYALQENFAKYFYENDCSDIIIAVAWTNHLRYSWWSDDQQRWIHDGFIRYNNDNDELFMDSFKEWLALSYNRCEQITKNAKLFVNSVCQSHGIKLIQFDALPNINGHYDNFHQQGRNMLDVLKKEAERLDRTFITAGDHPTEAGHAYYAKLLHSWIRAKKNV